MLSIPTPPPRQPFPSTSKNEKSNAFNFDESKNSRRDSIESSEEATPTTPIPSKSRDVESETETTTNHPSSILRPQTFSFKKIHETLDSSMKSTTQDQEEGAATTEWSIRNKSITWADIEGESDSISCIIVLSASTTSDDDIRASLSRMKEQEEQGEEEYYWSDLDDDGKEDDDTTTLPESKSEDDSICSSDSSSGDGYDSFRRSTSSTSQIRFSLVYDD